MSVTLPVHDQGARVHVRCAAKVANARGGGGGGIGAGGEEEDEEERLAATAAAWRMLSGYERRSREASVMVEALARVVAGGAPPADARREAGSPAGGLQGYGYYGEMLPSHAAPPPPHGNQAAASIFACQLIVSTLADASCLSSW